MWHDAIYDLTPIENISGVWFKREDKFSPDRIHNGSKFRQLIWLFSRKSFPGVASGAVSGSPQLPMVAACAKHYGMECHQFTGARKLMALAGGKLGAVTHLCDPGYGRFCGFKAKEFAEQHGFLHIETNITTGSDIAAAFHRVGAEQVKNLPDHIETLILPAGSRNSATSILYGLHLFPPKSLKKIIFMNIHGNLKKNEEWMWKRLKVCGVGRSSYEFVTYDVFANGYTDYADWMPFSYGDLHFHGRYEGKIWNYIKDNLTVFQPYLNEKTVFWIVGSEPGSSVSQGVSSRSSACSLRVSVSAHS